MKKVFNLKNVFFNNGLINIFNHLQNNNLGIDFKLENRYLEIDFKDNNQDEIYFKILEIFLKDFKIVHQTKNDRWYFDEKKQDFIIDKRYDIKGKASGNDILSGVYIYKTIQELGFSNKDEVENLYLTFCEKNNIKPESNVPNKLNKLVVIITHDEAIQKFSQYLIKGDIVDLDSKIHQFESGGKSFRDMLPNKTDKITKWEALIYWFGAKIQKYYNSSFYIYPNSMDLKALQLFKNDLRIEENVVEYRDKKTDKIKRTSSNIDFYDQLSKDNIKNSNFYISKSEEEFELKFFMYLFSKINHIEEEFTEMQNNEEFNSLFFEHIDDLSKESEILFNVLEKITFITYTEDGDFKSSLNEYSKVHRLIEFFKILKDNELFEYLSNLITTIALCKKTKEVNLIIKDFTKKILNFQNLRKGYYLASLAILKNGSRGLGNQLYKFEDLYLKEILQGKYMDLHEKSKSLGDGIGNFSANLSDKDLLFKLRNIKNHKQLVSYFKDLEFRILKDGDKARLSKEFRSNLKDILDELNKTQENWEIVRDYIAIYAIDKFKATEYSKSQKGEK